ncbi:hypothetical protein [Halomonas sp. 3A7M]|uniref:hypothetical protein n=1 Tax=Halomonas sp. 3A7M TaxID=2742616 RepID=UPI001866742B|nr:hypothetical protein [Halomonas sp. 3A7M]
MNTRNIKTLAVATLSALTLAACTSAPTYHGNSNGVSRVEPGVSIPRVSGSSAGGNVRAHATTQVGTRQMPATVSVGASTSQRGTVISPVIRSKYFNWRF